MRSDEELFSAGVLDTLRVAVAELSWLLSRGYRQTSALKLVGDRHGLTSRQRKAAAVCSCSEEVRRGRLERHVPLETLGGRPLAIDGFNCLITLETAFSGGVVLVGRDGAHRDLASVQGTYRAVQQTGTAVRWVGEVLAAAGTREVTWHLDRPVSNSGRLKTLLEDQARTAGWNWSVALQADPDRVLARSDAVVATSDGWILDRCRSWTNLVGEVLRRRSARPWVLNLGPEGPSTTAAPDPVSDPSRPAGGAAF